MEAEAIAMVKALFAQRRAVDIAAFLSDDVELRPPTYDTCWRGRALVAPLLDFAAASFDSLVYTDSLEAKGLHMLRFEARLGDRALTGVDLIRLDAQGRITLFEIFSRPPDVALLLLERMAAHIRQSPQLLALMRSHRPGQGRE
ncbi:MAG: hypothetical protein AB7E60_06615 [Sphingobium sp.]